MTDRTGCSIDDCDKPAKTRGWCNMHYTRWHRHGDPLHTETRPPGPDARFWPRVDKSGTCWLWTGPKNNKGYGRLRLENGDRKHLYAHRVAYSLLQGPIPEGMFLDHTCHTPSCVNPDHLRVVTPKQNNENQSGAHGCNATGVRGVRWDAARNKYMAQVGHNGRTYHLGRFDSIEEAAEAAKAKRIELFTHNDADRTKEAV